MAAEQPERPKVFVCYVREDAEQVGRLVDDLKDAGINVWWDKRIKPGERWKGKIRQHIRDGNFFVACFSDEYWARSATYMNEELIVACEELRLRARDTAWFIPVRLSECDIPELPIGPGETLRDLQWVDLWRDWDEGIRQIVQTVAPQASMPVQSSPEQTGLQDDDPDPFASMNEAITAWRNADTTSKSAVAAAKATLAQALDQLLAEGLAAVELMDAERVRRVAEHMRDTYAWGAQQDLGFQGESTRAEMLSFAVPSLEALARFFVIGAMAAKHRRLPLCRTLITDYRIELPDRSSRLLVSHPLWAHVAGHGEHIDRHFRLALQIVESNERFAVPLPREAKDPLCEFDFLVEVFFQCLDRVPRHWPNYGGFLQHRAKRITEELVRLRDDPEVVSVDWKDRLAKALVIADRKGNQSPQLVWETNQDWPEGVREYLESEDALKYYSDPDLVW